MLGKTVYVCVCLCEEGACVVCVMVFYHLLSHNTLGIVYVCECVCVGREVWLLGDPSCKDAALLIVKQRI